MPVNHEVQVAVAQFLANSRIPANAPTNDWYDIIFLLTEAVTGENDVKADRSYIKAVKRMLTLGWTNQKELDALAAQFENP